MAALRQIAFYGKGGIGKSKRKAQLVTASIEHMSITHERHVEHARRRRLPRSVRCRLHFKDSSRLGERKATPASEERQRLHTPRRVKTHTDIVRRLVGSSTQIVPSTMRPISRSNCLKESN
ncbi:hypothetical protein [Sinorhizobium meliloti]|uniref:hypothetical protein n=1 Tax=Rhizobium meliloti TaxID=382 RepID=UPI0013E30909|nr:hypothetical protein [Sinorhizobium meliloti]MCK3785415.1 hypothetical protein [Sinorhizobium meliloti]MCK3791541.1 hypothetical protein [Sinorhizobium meliloti]MCK3797329.1 hypothetical protein [Sinorhizobium meliloti]MDE4579779.1 hypothetical protein [Sinorhizobium meliloti]WGI77294.1 hypothetical protein QC756_21265 [Sinorhizobium meliloti]